MNSRPTKLLTTFMPLMAISRKIKRIQPPSARDRRSDLKTGDETATRLDHNDRVSATMNDSPVTSLADHSALKISRAKKRECLRTEEVKYAIDMPTVTANLAWRDD